MKKSSRSTRKPSELTELLNVVLKLTAELQAQSESNRKTSEKLLEALTERDAQIRLVLESKFQPMIQMVPTRTEPKQEPDSIEHLADVSEVSEASAEAEMVKSTKAFNQASATLEQDLTVEFTELAREHAQSHQGAPQ